MRKILSSVLAVLMLLTSIRFLFLKPKTVYADTLLTFDEGYGTSAQDTIGSNDGSISGAAWRTDDMCISGKCVYFDGAGDGIQVADNATLDFGTGSFTVQFWFRHSDANQDAIVSKSMDSLGVESPGFRIRIMADGDIEFAIDDDSSFTPDDLAGSNYNDGRYHDNKWHYITAVKNGTTSISLYIDGSLAGTNTPLTATGSLNNNNPLTIGHDGAQVGDLSGFIDEFKIYNSARTADEIKADYNGVTTSKGTSVSFEPDQSYLSNGLIGYWKMDQTSGTTTTDSSGAKNTGTIGGTPSFGAGKFGNTISFDGIDDYVDAGSDVSLDQLPQLTASAWIYADALTTDAGRIIAKNGQSTGAGWRFMLDNTGNRLVFAVSGTTNLQLITQNNTITLNAWHHVLVTWTGDITNYNSAKIYIDGIEAPINTGTSANGSARSDDSALDLCIGSRCPTSLIGMFDGRIDDVRLYNHVLSDTEIRQLYVWAPEPVGWWKLDENSGTSANDSAGNGNTGTFTNSPDWHIGKYGSGLFLDPLTNNKYITVPSSASLDNLTQFTWEAWVNPTQLQNRTILSKSGNIQLYFDTISGGLRTQFRIGCDGITDLSLFSTSREDLTFDAWHHLAATWDGSSCLLSSAKVYVDGRLADVHINSDNGAGNKSSDAGSALIIGNYSSTLTQQVQGSMDDVRIYNYPRTNAQIVQDMNAGHPAPGSPVGSPIGYWKMDDGYGTVANDSTLNDNDLTLSAASWTNDGKFGKAWNGTGSNPYLSMADDSDFDFLTGEDFTLSGWVKSDSAANPGSAQYIIEKHLSGNNPGYSFYLNTSGQIVCEIGDDAITFPKDSATSTGDFYDNAWHNVVCIRNVTQDKLYLYVDGNLNNQDTDLSATSSLANAVSLFVGAQNSSDGGTDDFAGDIDEVKIFRLALTPEEIKVEFNAGSSALLGATSTDASGVGTWSSQNEYCPPGQGSLCAHPIGEWKFDENSGTTSVNDTSENNNSGTMDAFSSDDWIPGKYGSSLTFDATDNRINLASPTILDNIPSSGGLSISVWLYPRSDGEGNTGRIALKDDGADDPQNGWQFNVDSSSRFSFSAGFNGAATDLQVVSSTTYTANTWQHIELTWDGSTNDNNVHIYKDGVEVSYAIQTAGAGTYRSDAANNMYIGNGITQADTFDGYIDEFRIYNYQRTPAQVAWEYNRGGPVAWWKMDESLWNGTANEVKDSSGKGLHGVRSGNATTAAGKFNNGGTFDGTGDFFDVTDNIALDITGDFTLSAWVNLTTSGLGNQFIITKRSGAGGGGGYDIAMGNLGEVYCQTDNGTTTVNSITPNGVISTTAGWQHIAAVRSGTSCKVYIDASDRTSTIGTHTTLTANNNAIRVGGNLNGTEFWNGQIDDPRIYNFAMTSKQIQVLYDEGAASRIGP